MKKQFKTMHIASLELFLVAAENENFSVTAQYLNITPAAVSRSIKRLEERIGFDLFSRSTRQVKLTQEGRIYYKKCSEIFDMLINAGHSIKNEKNAIGGRLKISVPETFFNYKISPYLANFSEEYPNLKLDFHVTNRNIDFVAEEYDLSVRLVQENTKLEAFLIKKRLFIATTGLYASPNYLAKNGMIVCPDELINHKCINFSSSQNNKRFQWAALNKNIYKDNIENSQIQIFDSIQATKFLALNDGGIVQLFSFSVQEELKRKELVEILSEYNKEHTWEFCFLYPSTYKNSTKLKVFIEYFTNKISR
ncbi:hypothetical protein A9G09_04925 [Gilliamella sp. wkB292]|uniref:LysR family transcriptional regulator n=1 Tax=unclassified Gilliamella TaxID=2685620 RepID=UPI00080E4F7B|nr:LysR family transcriptional regulator [Gilliamella apicola]OCG14991.1 hypothetical protein A9G09_04925 [Gilliamella apicola]OCL28876.1 hypothetical protein A9G03_01395 [Gilliamella apicola]